MAKSSLVYGLLLVLAAESAILSVEGGQIKRVVRSPHCTECEDHGPPPPVFHTHQWTGVEKTADGINGVFSGAAAGVADGLQTAGQAFSLASSGVDASAGAAAGATVGAAAGSSSGVGLGAALKTDSGIGLGVGTPQGNGADIAGAGISSRSSFGSSSSEYGGQSAGGYSRRGFGGDGNSYGYGGYNGNSAGSEGHFIQSGGAGIADSGSQSSFGSSSAEYGRQSAGGYSGRGDSRDVGSYNYGRHNGNSVGYGGGQGFKSFRESHYTYRDNKNFGGQNSQSQGGSQNGFGPNIDRGQFGGSERQSSSNAQSSSYGSGVGGSSNAYESGILGRHHGYDKLRAGEGFSNGQQRQVGSERFENQQQLQSSGGGQWENGVSADGSSGAETQQASENTQSALSGALSLASQGVDASQQAKPGCSTCGKSNYALSNAKSHSGNAIAVSVGG